MTATVRANSAKAKSAAAAPPGPEAFAIGPRIWLGSGVMAFLILGCGGWAATAELSGAVMAPGSVIVDRHSKKVQHRDGGIVAEILVREGDKVAAGDTLLRLDDTQTRAELAILRSQLVELTGRKSRLAAERDGSVEITLPANFEAGGPEAVRVAVGERRLFDEARKTRTSQKEQLGLRIGQLEQEIDGLGKQSRAKRSELDIIEKELGQIRGLRARNLTPISRVYAMEREATRLEGEHGSLISQIARAGGQISELNLQILAVDQTTYTEAQRELRAIEARMAELAEREIAALDRLNRMELKAPQSGLIHELSAHTVGGVISPVEAVMLIVPEDEALTVEMRLSPIDIDQISVGQEARIRFTAFNQRETPEVTGQILMVAADTTTDPRTGHPYYAARVSIDESAREKLAGLRLIPGMPAEIHVPTGDRTALSYLVKPFTDQFTRAFRED